MPIGTRHAIDPNFKPGGSLGVIEQLDLTTSYPQTVAIVDGSGNQITSFTTPAITGFATSAKQLADGHNVQVNALSTIYAGTKTVPTGTAEAIATTQTIHSVTVKALSTNTVAVYVGPSGATTSSFELLAGESVSLDVTDIASVFVISGSASQVVRWIAV